MGPPEGRGSPERRRPSEGPRDAPSVREAATVQQQVRLPDGPLRRAQISGNPESGCWPPPGVPAGRRGRSVAVKPGCWGDGAGGQHRLAPRPLWTRRHSSGSSWTGCRADWQPPKADPATPSRTQVRRAAGHKHTPRATAPGTRPGDPSATSWRTPNTGKEAGGSGRGPGRPSPGNQARAAFGPQKAQPATEANLPVGAGHGLHATSMGETMARPSWARPLNVFRAPAHRAPPPGIRGLPFQGVPALRGRKQATGLAVASAHGRGCGATTRGAGRGHLGHAMPG
ncbi:PREDICTED: adenomatous polyposis coli protein 2-like [Condylura cristata]|uniref:adenomatous polyposis coli protein 2-like n=1 Tax=Condylura cristata TaxID=143302 RepID=UPI0006435D3D|nr:PREDICTED: adenomatous polyposis coli protein 2-like [Condylura cristata]